MSGGIGSRSRRAPRPNPRARISNDPGERRLVAEPLEGSCIIEKRSAPLCRLYRRVGGLCVTGAHVTSPHHTGSSDIFISWNFEATLLPPAIFKLMIDERNTPT